MVTAISTHGIIKPQAKRTKFVLFIEGIKTPEEVKRYHHLITMVSKGAEVISVGRMTDTGVADMMLEVKLKDIFAVIAAFPELEFTVNGRVK